MYIILQMPILAKLDRDTCGYYCSVNVMHWCNLEVKTSVRGWVGGSIYISIYYIKQDGGMVATFDYLKFT